MGACSASFVRRGGCAAAAACSRRNTALIATAIEDYAKGEPAGRVAAASPQLGGAFALRTCARAGGWWKPLRAAAATTRLLGFAFGEVARPTRERTGEAAARIHTH